MHEQENNSRERPERQWLEYTVWRSRQPFVPPTDVLVYPDKILVMVEIAALHPSDLNITLLENQLVIAGARERPAQPEAAYHQVEIGYGEFRVTIDLHWTVQRDGVTATYRDGLLHVELPRLPKSQIPVKDSKDAE